MYRSHVLGTAAAVLLILSSAALGRNSLQAQPAVAAERRSGDAGRAEDVLPALLVEVKGLRAAVEQMADAGHRVQLAVSRLQLQEARVNGMIRRLDTVRDTLGTARRDVERAKGALKMLQGTQDEDTPAEDLGPMLDGMKQEVVTAQAAIDRLAGEEAHLMQDLTTEQARWIDFNQRLDELERALVKR